MITKGLFSQLAMIVLAIGIGYLYVLPTFNTIGEMQDETALYKSEREKIEEVNFQLAQLTDRLDGISASDKRKLLTYMPDTVDSIAVSRLLQSMSARSGVLVEEITYEGVLSEFIKEADLTGVVDFPVPHEFTMSVVGTYEQIKALLAQFEVNEYPLEVHELEISVVRGNFLNASMVIRTYSHIVPEESVFKIR